MENLKIKVNNEAESKEAQELFFELGYTFSFSDKDKSIRTSEIFNFPYFLSVSGNGQMCFMLRKSDHQELTLPQLRDLVVKHRKQSGLISGADALRALADGKEVEYFDKLNAEWDSDTSILPINVFTNESVKFRLKPHTIKIELEIPAPFEPKDGDICFVVDNDYQDGWASFMFSVRDPDHKAKIQFGTYRTKEEIKKVVEALRKLKGVG